MSHGLGSKRGRFLLTSQGRTFPIDLETRPQLEEGAREHVMVVVGGDAHTSQSQSVTTLIGHSNYVTSLKMRRDVLISGSYDET